MSLNFFKQLKNNVLKKDKYVKNITEEIKEDFELDLDDAALDQDRIDEVKDNITSFEEYLKDKISNYTIPYDSYFDNDIKKHLDILHSYISRYIPNYPAYYDDENINGKAFLDARDFIKNEMPVTVDEILEMDDTVTGIVNDTKINFDNGFQLDSYGNVYNTDRRIIFKPQELYQKVSYVDLINNKVITENGIRVELPSNFIKDNIYDNDEVSDRFKDRLEELIEIVESNKKGEGSSDGSDGSDSESSSSSTTTTGNSSSSTTVPDNVFGVINGVYITEADRIFMEMPLENTYTGDIFGDDQDIDIVSEIKSYKTNTDAFSMCNFKEIPYSELNSLLFWGGGERGVKPLSSTEISDADISFKSDGTVYYTGTNSTITTKRSGCSKKTYKTGHCMMWSSSNQVGVKRSIIQYIYSFCASVGIFNANIPKLVGFKKFKVFPGLCIGGLLENVLCAWQEKLSTRINEMFQCVPTSMAVDLAESGFEDETYAYGSSVETLSDLDNIKSTKYGNRYVVNIVDMSVTGLSEYACGLFVFDPNDKLAATYPWKYKDFRGKPFDKDNVAVITDYQTSYENPIVQDILENTNALGEDSITRKLMSLQYAYMKKETLLSLKDIETTMDATIEATIYDMLDKLTLDIGRYAYMVDLHLTLESQVPGFESSQYTTEFFNHFDYLTSNGIYKKPELANYKKTYVYTTETNEDSTSITRVSYYDFDSLDPDEYLIPYRDYVSKYDTVMFGEKFAPNEQLKELFENNLSYLESVSQEDIGKYQNISTIRDFINTSESKEAYEIDIKDSLTYIQSELDYDGYEDYVFSQVEKRCYYVVDKKKIF